MISNDFTQIFWLIGQAVLQGRDPYLVQGNVYPPAANFFFILFAILPVQTSFKIWVIVNIFCVLFYLLNQKYNLKSLIWFGFTPLLFVLASGQIDLIFLTLSSFLVPRGWVSVIVAAIITLKPQIAFVLLPWILVNWLFLNRPQLFRWLVLTFILHLSPLLFDPLIYQRWWMSTSRLSNMYILNSPGILGLRSIGIPLEILIPFALLIFALGFVLNKKRSIVTSLLALPFGTWYNLVLMVGVGPGIWMVFTSWVAFGLAVIVKGSYPFLLIPLVAFYFVMRENGGLRFSFSNLPIIIEINTPKNGSH